MIEFLRRLFGRWEEVGPDSLVDRLGARCQELYYEVVCKCCGDIFGTDPEGLGELLTRGWHFTDSGECENTAGYFVRRIRNPYGVAFGEWRL